MNDQRYMSICLDLAQTPRGLVSPNPYVGSVIVKDGKILGKGFHQGPGQPHAEIEAINDALKNSENSIREDGLNPLKGSTLYCNLEPCCHTNKRTPPCAQRLVSEGFAKVVIANLDPNPHVAGKGVEILRKAGIEVVTGILEEEGKDLNEIFFKHIVAKMPFVHLKWAQTLDGKIATESKSSKWITSEKARAKVHWERLACDAILVGAQTLRDDNPSLTIRMPENSQENPAAPYAGKTFKRVVLASQDDFSRELKFFSDEHKESSILITPEDGSKRLHLPKVLADLYQRGICSVYVEGGSGVLSQFYQEGLYDKLSVYIAPKILGNGISPINANLYEDMSKVPELQNVKVESLGADIYITAAGGPSQS